MSKLFPTAVLRTRAPYRFDIVGSFLRPEALKQARRQCACGECSMEAMHTVEDAEIHKNRRKTKSHRLARGERWRISPHMVAFGFSV